MLRRLQQTRSVLVLAVLAVTLLFGVPLAQAATPTAAEYRTAINQTRTKQRLPRLTPSYTLNRAALLRVQDMAVNHYFAHTSPRGTTHTMYLLSGPGEFSRSGEILGRNFLTTQRAISAWLASPSHAAQLRSTSYTHFGAAVGQIVVNKKTTNIVIVVFGRVK